MRNNVESMTEKKLSEFNELAFKMLRIHRLQDRVNSLWQSPTEMWVNNNSMNGAPEYGFILIIRALCSLYKEVRPKCTNGKSGEKEKGDKMRNKLSEKSAKGVLAISNKAYNGDKKVLNYKPNKWNDLRKEIETFEDFIRDMIQEHGFTPDKSDVKGL